MTSYDPGTTLSPRGLEVSFKPSTQKQWENIEPNVKEEESTFKADEINFTLGSK